MAPWTTQSPAALNKAETLAADVPCLTCGYNLRGLQSTGHCPECGQAIDPCFRQWRAFGPGALERRAWMRQVVRGLNIGLVVLVGAVINGLCLIFVSDFISGFLGSMNAGSAASAVELLLLLAGLPLAAWGLWSFTWQPPAGPARRRRTWARLLGRWSGMVCLGSVAAAFVTWQLWGGIFPELLHPALAAILTAALAAWALGLYAAELADMAGAATLSLLLGFAAWSTGLAGLLVVEVTVLVVSADHLPHAWQWAFFLGAALLAPAACVGGPVLLLVDLVLVVALRLRLARGRSRRLGV